MNPSWSSEKPSLASKVPETPTNRLFFGDIQNKVNRYKKVSFNGLKFVVTGDK
jgi:hypothetical protein